MKRIVVAIHGVGDAAVGDVGRALTALLAPYTPPFQRNDFVLGGTEYFRVTSTNDDDPVELIEVNWADIGAPRRTWFGLIVHCVKFVHIMLRSCEQESRVFGSWNRRVFEAFVIWTPYPLFLCLFWMSLPDVCTKVAMSLLLICIVGAILILTWKWSASLRYGGCLTIIALASLWIYFSTQDSTHEMNRTLTTIYGYAPGASFLTITGVAISLFFGTATAGKPAEVKLTYFALASLPLVILSAIGAVLWLAVLSAVV